MRMGEDSPSPKPKDLPEENNIIFQRSENGTGPERREIPWVKVDVPLRFSYGGLNPDQNLHSPLGFI